MEGKPFGRYRLIDLLGQGGMGEVWRAFDTGTSRVVALKLLPTQLASDATFEQRFRREALVAASLSNPHVVPIHDFGEIDGRLFVNMRLIEGHDLQDALKNGPMAPDRAVHIIDQVAKALHAAHSADLIHRDVKPSNILIADDDFAYLIDFGIARAASDTGMTVTGTTIGTWAYMAPERFNTGKIDARSDVYSLACVLHECLTNRRPYSGNSFEQLIAGHLFTPPPSPSLINDRVPPAFDDVIAMGMAKDPAERYPTVRELATAARTAATSTPSVPTIPRPPSPPPIPHPISNPTPPAARRPDPPPRPTPMSRTETFAATPPPSSWRPSPTVSPMDPTRHRSSLVPESPAAEDRSLPDEPNQTGRRVLLVGGGLAAVIAIVVTAALLRDPADVRDSLISAGSTSVTTSVRLSVEQPTPKLEYGAVVVLPFSGLDSAGGVTVDGAGNVYVADSGHGTVLRLAPGSNQQPTVAVSGLAGPGGIAIDGTGNLYIAEWDQNRVVKVPPGSSQHSQISIPGLNYPTGVALDASGNLYVADLWNSRIVKVATGSGAIAEVPFTGLDRPAAVAVNAAGDVFAADTYNDRIVMLPASGAPQTVLPIQVGNPRTVAVDTAGAVYVATSGALLKLPPGAAQSTELAMANLSSPQGLAVDAAGNVYASEWIKNGRVLKLPKN